MNNLNLTDSLMINNLLRKLDDLYKDFIRTRNNMLRKASTASASNFAYDIDKDFDEAKEKSITYLVRKENYTGMLRIILDGICDDQISIEYDEMDGEHKIISHPKQPS